VIQRLALLVAFVVAVAVSSSCIPPAHAAPVSPPQEGDTALVETLGAIKATDGWCVATNGVTNIDLAASAPARVTTTIWQQVRFVSVRFIAGATSTRMCHAVQTSLQASACATLGANSAGVLTDGQSATYAAARDFKPSSSGVHATPVNVQANAGTDGFFCMSIGW